jgi:hypothetical protein
MLHRCLLAVILCALSSLAFSQQNCTGFGGCTNNQPQANSANTNSLANTLSSNPSASANGGTHVQTNTQTAVQTNAQTTITTQGQQQGQGQVGINKQGQVQTNGNGNNWTYTNVNPDEMHTTGIAPTIFANPTAPCRVAVGVSAGWFGGGAGVTASVLDEGCDARADVALLAGVLDDRAAAVARACQKAEIAKALGAKCPATAKSAAVAPSAKDTNVATAAGDKVKAGN